MKLWDRIQMWLSKPPKPLHSEEDRPPTPEEAARYRKLMELRPDNPSNQPFHETDEEPKL